MNAAVEANHVASLDLGVTLYEAEATLLNWAQLESRIDEYVRVVNSTALGKVCPSTAALKAFFRRQVANRMFTELGLVNKNARTYCVLAQDNIACPIEFSGGPGYTDTSLDYMAWRMALDEGGVVEEGTFLETANGGSASETLMRGELSFYPQIHTAAWFDYVPRQDYGLEFIPLRMKDIQGNPDNLHAVSEVINSIMLSNLQKYVTAEGPHYYNIPQIQATFFDADLNENIYTRWLIKMRGQPLGYCITERVGIYYTVSQLLLDFTVKDRPHIRSLLAALLLHELKPGAIVYASSLLSTYFHRNTNA